jgi:hypothetical protein
MKKYYILLAGAILTATIQTQAQTKIGGPGAPDSSAMLEVTSGAGNNKGILLPRISLANITTWGLNGSTPVAGMFVYNTNAAVTGGSGVGTYYWDGTQWVKSTSASVSGWDLVGNAATNPATNFLGTTDAQPLVLRTNATEKMRIASTGNVGIGTATPGSKLHVSGNNQVNMTVENTAGTIAGDYAGMGTKINSTTGIPISTTVISQSLPGETNGGLGIIRTGTPHDLSLGTNNAEHLRITTTGNVGINNAAPISPLSFATALGNKIAFFDGGTNQYLGVGVSASQLNYHVASNCAHVFYAGGTNGNGTELMRIVNNGNVGISNGNPLVPLSLANATGPKISMYDNNSATEHYGFGISGGQLNYQVMTGASHVFRTGGKNNDGTELMRIQGPDGNVGIGTATPGGKLHVSGNNQVNMIVENTGGTINGDYAGVNTKINSTTGIPISTMMFAISLPGEPNGGLGIIRTSTPHDLVLATNNAEHMRINTFGNVGIGTSTPTAKLDVNGTARIQGSAGTPTAITGRDAAGNINNITLGANLSLAGGVLSASGGGGTAGWALNGNTGTNFVTDYVGTADAQPLVLRTNGAEHLRITADGKIGINNGAPVASLDIVGSARISTSLGTPTTITGRDASGNVGNITLGANLSLAGGVLSASGGGTSGWGLTGNAGTNPATNFIGTTDAQPLVFSANNDEKMRIMSNGNVGIGTAAPNSYVQIAKNDYGQFGGLAISDVAGANATNFTITPGYYGSVATFGVTLDVTGEAPIGFSDPIIPAADGSFSCGTSAYRWSAVYSLNGTINTSDARMKKNVRDLGLGLDEIMKLRPVVYDWKNDTGKDKIGFIAQELRKVVPNVVVGDESKETLGVLYSDMIPVLTKAIQEQQAQIDALKAENQKLKTAEVELKDNKAVTAQLMERVKQMEQMMGINEIEGTSKVAGK